MIQIRNNTSFALKIDRVRTSCDCLTMRLESEVVEPHGVTAAKVSLDLTNQPRFAGRLAMTVEGLSDQSVVQFVLEVRVEARRE